MHTIQAFNVNDGFYKGLDMFGYSGNYIEQKTRNGTVWEIKTPVCISYKYPNVRVLQDPYRDCNPFFHLAESLWMLAGRGDLASMEHYVPRMREYSDDGKTLWGAYGYRWRWMFGTDQLKTIIKMLKKNPDDRRCVLQMWGAEKDLNHLEGEGKDVPCNTQIYFKIRDGALRMTVTNRSNDLIWGCFGANMVHFSVLHEYMAAMIGVKLGTYYHFTDNLHLYIDFPIWKDKVSKISVAVGLHNYNDKKYAESLHEKTIPLVKDTETFDKELKFVLDGDYRQDVKLNNVFLERVAIPAIKSWNLFKEHKFRESVEMAETILQEDWRLACSSYIKRRT
tara:strand:- start:8343 stop:9350 length:1008 start_codon:yes stop_codon:yes gene_type:complete